MLCQLKGGEMKEYLIFLVISWILAFLSITCIIAQLLQKDKQFYNKKYVLFVFGGIIFGFLSFVFSLTSCFI